MVVESIKSMHIKHIYLYLYIFLNFIFLIILAFLFYRYCHIPGVLEVREYAEANAAINIRNGTYFSLKNFPSNLYLYGPLQAFIVSLFNENFVLINRVIGVFSLFFIIFPVFFYCNIVLPSISTPYKWAIALFTTTIIIVNFLHSLTFGRPDAIGLFIFCCGISYGVSNCIKNQYIKNFLYILILFLALLSKQYYGIIFLLFLIKERKNIKGIITLIFSLIIFFIFCYHFLPVYLLSWLHHINNRGNLPYSNSITQFIMLFNNLNLFAVTLSILLVLYIFNTSKINNKNCNTLLTFTLIIAFLLFLSMGRHTGNWMTYYNELLVPCLAFLFILLIPYAPQKIIVAVMFLCLITVGKPQVTFFYQNLKKREIFTTYNIEPTGKIFVCPSAFQDPAFREKDIEKDAGQMWYLDTLYSPINHLQTLENIQLADINRENYKKNLINKLRNREYDLIIFDDICILNHKQYKELLIENYSEKKINNHASIFITNAANKN